MMITKNVLQELKRILAGSFAPESFT